MSDDSEDERIVALIDMDCFYCQVIIRDQPELRGQPIVVLQYSDALDGGSSAIAVSYEARALGIKRGMRKKDVEQFPNAKCVVMPHNQNHTKADLTIFRKASTEVMSILAQHATIFERASIDEAYIDITANVKRMIGLPINKTKLQKTYIAGMQGSQSDQMEEWCAHITSSPHHSYDYRLTLAAVYINMIRAQILADTQFTCSAGIGANKIVAKLAAGTHKPDAQTLIPPDKIAALYQTISLTKIRNFGGKLGRTLQEDLSIEFASELVKFSQADLISRYGDKTGSWIYNIARGVDNEPVKQRSLVKQTACAKNFPQGINLVGDLEKWVSGLAYELEERLAFELEDNRRIPTQFSLHMRLKVGGSSSTVMPLVRFDQEHLASCAMKNIMRKLKLSDGVFSDTIFMLSIGGNKFVPAPEKDNIFTMLRKMEIKKPKNEEPKSEPSDSLEGASTSSSTSDKTLSKPQKLSGFFEKMKSEVGTSSLSSPPTTPTKPTISVLESVDKENNRLSWNSLSEEDTNIMLAPVEGIKTKCPVCSKPILEIKLAEHLDFHTALTLQREIETQLRQEAVSKTESPKRKLPFKRGRPSKLQKTIKTRDISSFFKKS